MPEKLYWHRVSNVPAAFQSELGYELCLLRTDGFIVADRQHVKYVTSSGNRWTTRITSTPLGRSTIIATADVVAVVGTKEAVGINVSDDSICWQLDHKIVGQQTG